MLRLPPDERDAVIADFGYTGKTIRQHMIGLKHMNCDTYRQEAILGILLTEFHQDGRRKEPAQC